MPEPILYIYVGTKVCFALYTRTDGRGVNNIHFYEIRFSLRRLSDIVHWWLLIEK